MRPALDQKQDPALSAQDPRRQAGNESHAPGFLRSYLAIVLGILFIALALDSLLAWLLPEEDPVLARQRQGFALARLLLSEDDSDPRGRFETLEARLEDALGAPLNLLEERDIAGLGTVDDTDELLRLEDEAGRQTLYQRWPEQGLVLALGPLDAARPRTARLEALLIISYYLLVACLVFLWIRPFFRDLSRLRAAAARFGRDGFASRVALPASSSILPVAHSFNAMAERIAYLVSAHRELTHAVSHELRSPLARCKFTLEMLARTDDAVKKADYLTSLKADLAELEGLVDELLRYARLSEDNLRLQREDLPLAAWLHAQAAQYEGARVTLRLELTALPEGGRVSADPDLLARALHNLLRNGLRYAERELRLAARLEQGQVIVEVCDDGPGIPAEQRQSVLEPFARLDTSRDRQSGGHGLGLAIARRILQRHGGDISVSDNTPRGACFTLRWPLAESGTVQGASQSRRLRERPRATGPRVSGTED